MEQQERALLDAGLTKNETKVYLALVAGGRDPVARIADRSGVHRVNVYDALQGLQHKGLASEIQVGKKRQFVASPPEALRELLRKREERLNTIIPTLTAQFTRIENRTQTYEGLDGIKTILDDMLLVGKDIVAFGIPKAMPDLLGGHLISFHRRRIEKNISIKHIYNENAQERIAHLNKLKGSKAKYLPPEYSVPATTVIYGDRVAFWIWSEQPFSVLIESEKMAEAYRKYFEILWKLAK